MSPHSSAGGVVFASAVRHRPLLNRAGLDALRRRWRRKRECDGADERRACDLSNLSHKVLVTVSGGSFWTRHAMNGARPVPRGHELCETLLLMILRLDQRQWGASESAPSSPEGNSTAQLEAGALLMLPELAFDVLPGERVHFSPSIAAAKNVSFDPSTGQVGGAR